MKEEQWLNCPHQNKEYGIVLHEDEACIVWLTICRECFDKIGTIWMRDIFTIRIKGLK